MDYKVVILAAGAGKRLGALTENFHKALLPLGGTAIISQILEKFPREVEVVVAVGYEGNKLRDYLRLAHPDRTFRFVEVDKVLEKGAGPGYSLLACQKWLQCPFVITTVDTLVEENVPEPSMDWIGVGQIAPEEAERFNTVEVQRGRVMVMRDKEASGLTHAFIGLAGIHGFETFWRALASDRGLIRGERQLSSGLQAQVKAGRLAAVEFTWFDTGDEAGLVKARREFSKEKSSDYDFSKRDEYIYIMSERVIKYFADAEVAHRRAQRAKILAGIVPEIVAEAKHFYSYQKIPGVTLYEKLHRGRVEQFLTWLEKNLWKPVEVSEADYQTLQQACRKFYREKTQARLTQYFTVTGESDESLIVNGTPVASVHQLLRQVAWGRLEEPIPSAFHGDLQFDNVLVTDEAARPFVLIDWRQDFAGETVIGDRYYDLAKLYGGMILPYHFVKQNLFSFEREGKEITFDFHQTYALGEARAAYEEYVQAREYDWEKIRLLTALIFLNMAALHTPPFRDLLRALGAIQLQRVLEGARENVRT